MTYKEHLAWKDKYPAVDGIPKSDRNFRGADRGEGQIYSPAERSIRSDIEKILELPDNEFEIWFKTRKQATERLLADYEVYSSIPSLIHGSEKQLFDMTEATHVKEHLLCLRKGLEYLEVLRQVREEVKPKG